MCISFVSLGGLKDLGLRGDIGILTLAFLLMSCILFHLLSLLSQPVPCVSLQPLRGISILKQAIDKMQMNANQLTSVHADLCQVSAHMPRCHIHQQTPVQDGTSGGRDCHFSHVCLIVFVFVMFVFHFFEQITA